MKPEKFPQRRKGAKIYFTEIRFSQRADSRSKNFLYYLALLCAFCAFAGNSSAQTLTETSSKIRSAVENKDYRTASSELTNLESRDKKIFELNNYDYLRARSAEKSGDFARAMADYQAVVNRNSVLTEYALWHLSQIGRGSGNLMLERIYLRQLLALAPESLLTGAANARMARSYFESRDFGAAIQMLNRQLSVVSGQSSENTKDTNRQPATDNRNPKTREISALLGQAYLQNGKNREAREIFTRLINNLPNPAQPDDFALTAARALDRLDGGAKNFGKTAAQMPDNEHFRRASIYQFNRDFPAARLHFQAIVERHPASGYVPDALYQTGRSFVQERNFNEAIIWFERVLAELPEHPVARDALSQAASAYARVSKPKVAVARYQTFIEKYPDADNLDRAYLNIIDVLRDNGEDGNALNWTTKTRETFKGKLPEALALFAQARIRISLGDWQSALGDLNNLQNFGDLGGARVPGGTNRAEVDFLRGVALENLNRFAEAIDVYLSIPDGRSEYYGWRATERLRAMANDKKTDTFIQSKKESLNLNTINLSPEDEIKIYQPLYRLTNDNKYLEILKKSYAQLSDYEIPTFKLLDLGRREVLQEKRETQNRNHHQILADELLFLGLYDEGAPELERDEQSAKDKGQRTKDENQNLKSDFAYTLAVFYKRGDAANRAVAFAEPLWRGVPADYQIELIPRDQIELLYPAPYIDSLLKYAPERNVDARFMLAIMRQESRYRADVKSNAAARGLMQFISTTADKLAAGLGKTDFKQDELYNPPTAILFGAQYLSDLFKIFPNQPQAVSASYNGGEDNMTRWLARANSMDADRYVPEIAFTQSKDYVYKVLANYRVYRMFYDEKLKVK
ncbi:MAG: transglycosylase SLT domain-containing protein [Acidobacteriota bacterium]|nr:transglycosylase SLT domain-containing protein [Acidobacteriota bacterium]